MKAYTYEGSDAIRECVGAAIFQFLENTDFEDISVNEICYEAHIGRTTFYRYFGTKNGKLNALQFWLVQNWHKYRDRYSAREPSMDKLFLSYLYHTKKQMLLLHRNGLTHMIDDIIFDVFDSNRDENNLYLNYAGAGIWIGIVRAILLKEYADDANSIYHNVHDGVARIVAQNKRSKKDGSI